MPIQSNWKIFQELGKKTIFIELAKKENKHSTNSTTDHAREEYICVHNLIFTGKQHSLGLSCEL